MSMHKMLRWEKKGPYDTMKFFVLKNIENKIQDCFRVRSCNTYMLNCIYTPTPVLLKLITCIIPKNCHDLTLLSKEFIFMF